MGGLLGIAKGSDEDPKFIRLAYKGTGKKTIVLVGKGITFDSGGLSLKPDSGMETMKMDMAGAATVLGIFSALKTVKPAVNVVGLIAACENMPSGKAIKPGDVVTALNGKTIEIINTDAEGRVILADALSYASQFEKPDALIDLATLTGACMVALGEEIAGLFSNDKELAETLKTSAQKTGERVWEMPLVPEYRELIKGKVGDIKNSAGKKYGGAITAALFLENFVDPKIHWAHIDIAGPAFEEKGKPLTPYGGTGFGVRMLLDFINN
jgi:leucyl aminopeptidase